MSDIPKLVCLVTPAALDAATRVTQQTEALLAAGYRVHVVHGSASAVEPAAWPHTAIASTTGVATGFRRALARRLLPWAPFATIETATRVHGGAISTLGAAAAAVDAHYYIGHGVAGIAAAAAAAEQAHAKFGADLDALFEDASTDPAADPVLRSAVRIILATLLPRASHLTAAAPAIAESFATRYGVQAEVLADLSTTDGADRAAFIRLIKKAAGRP